MNKKDLLAFSVSTLCKGVDILLLEELLNGVSTRIEFHEKESLVLLSGTRYDELWVLLDGRVSAEMHHMNGKVVNIETIEAPDPIAPAILFAPLQSLPVSVRAAVDCRFIILPLETVLDLCQKNRRFLINFLTEIGGKISLFAEKFRLLEFAGLRTRIAAFLRPRLEQDSCMLEFSKEKMAEYLSVARPSLSRELSAMVSDGILEVDGRTIRVSNKEKFRALLKLEG